MNLRDKEITLSLSLYIYVEGIFVFWHPTYGRRPCTLASDLPSFLYICSRAIGHIFNLKRWLWRRFHGMIDWLLLSKSIHPLLDFRSKAIWDCRHLSLALCSLSRLMYFSSPQSIKRTLCWDSKLIHQPEVQPSQSESKTTTSLLSHTKVYAWLTLPTQTHTEESQSTTRL